MERQRAEGRWESRLSDSLREAISAYRALGASGPDLGYSSRASTLRSRTRGRAALLSFELPDIAAVTRLYGRKLSPVYIGVIGKPSGGYTPVSYVSQQLTQPQQSQQYQPQQQYQSQGTGMQSGTTAMGGQQGQGMSGGTLPQQYRQALDTVAQAVQVCGWCADQCIQKADPMMVECVRMCEDVVEIGEALLAVAPRSSHFTADLARTFAQAAQACAQECGRHSDAHCQECAQILPEAAQSAQQLGGTQPMGSTQTTGGMGQSTGGMGGQQLTQ